MNNDLISREALKNTIIGFCGKCSNIITKYENGVPDGNCAIHHILNIIDNAPTVKAYTKYDMKMEYLKNYKKSLGEWLCVTKSTFPQYQPDEYKCSFCNGLVHWKTNYCPNCGADMRGKDNDVR